MSAAVKNCEQTMHAFIFKAQLHCSEMSDFLFCFYLNSLALTFLFNSNCQLLKIPPYILQTLLFWRSEYLVVCTASEK